MRSTTAPLVGVRVLDFTRYEAGPTCTLLLAFLGAEVIKIEHPTKGAVHRRPFHPQGSKDDLYFVLLNLNKRSLCLDITSPCGRKLFEKLVKCSDVIVDNLDEKARKRLGLHYEELKKVNPNLIMASLSGYGSYGPLAGYPSMDMTAQAMGGIMSLTGERDSPPLRCGVSVADSCAGTLLALGVVAALYRREVTGKGGEVEVSLQDAAVHLGRSLMGAYIAYGTQAVKCGNRLEDVVPWDVYPARDGYVAICVISDSSFERLLEIIERKDLRLSNDIRERVRHREIIDQAIAEWTCNRTKYEILHTLGRQGVPCGAVLNSDEISGETHLWQRRMLVEIEHPHWGKRVVIGSPVKFIGQGESIQASPLLGQDTRRLLSKLLELQPSELERLEQEGTIKTLE